ncbi:unnamed protein product [Colias eurytheme]|nr:unnamed protein product [Colias eurytheme]
MSLSTLRSDLQCPLFGHGRDLKSNVLPTYEDIILCYIWLSRGKKQYRNLATDTYKTLSEKLLLVWQSASIPTIEVRSVIKRIKVYHEKYRILLKPYKSRKNVETYQARLKLFKEEAQFLFDIAACKCENFNLCKCPKELKVPILERAFLIDQRTERKMGIGRIDLKISTQNARRFLRKQPRETRQANCSTEPSSSYAQNVIEEQFLPDTSSSSVESTNEKNQDQLPSEPSLLMSREVTQKRNTISLATVARTVDRYGVSDRAAAAIVSAAFQDVGLITEESSTNIVDRNKIRRARELQRQTLINESNLQHNNSTFGLYFDGRKDKTLTMIDSSRRKIVVEEHISIIKEPNSEYIGHITLSSGRATVVSKKIIDFLQEKHIDLQNMVVVGCDGTVVNTGAKGGVIRCIERSLQKPLQWFICQLHANELSLRHMFEKLDGTTSGPRSFMGPIGKDLKDCEIRLLINYRSISCILPDISNVQDLSSDQQYLYDICMAINCGHCSISLSKKNPGKIVHSRWLTMANRLLRLYVSTTSPTENLIHLVTFILNVYAPMWFFIKTKPTCIYGAKHLHKTIILSRYLPEHLKMIVDPVIQRNGFFGHTENILLAMLGDERKNIRVLALRKILKARDSAVRGVREFKVPQLNFNAVDYIDIVIWNDVVVTEPPILKNISTSIILECIETPEKIDHFIIPLLKKYPCHTQATERCVKIVTEASAAVCGPIRRDGFIRTRLLSRKIMPVFETKKDYKTH